MTSTGDSDVGDGAGWVLFAATVLVMVGIFNIIDGIIALFRDEFFVPTSQGILVFDLTTWGWINLVTGILLLLVGLGLFNAQNWARIAAIILVVFNAVAQLTFISAYPFWSIVIIALDVFVIYALTVHGELFES
jgi:hypothetical protein